MAEDEFGLKEKVSKLPTTPGVYQFFDANGVIIYIGKAKNLKNRVSSYFVKTNQTSKTMVLVRKIRDLKYIVVNTEEDALLLENNLIKKLLENFKREGVLSQLDIGIITGYRGQKDLIRKSVNNSGYDRIAKGIDINTLDAFQGRENDVIIYSTVRTKNSIGFQKEKERVNVAFSRAKNLLIICGDMDFFYRFDDPDNKFIEIIDYICEHEDECLIIPGGEI